MNPLQGIFAESLRVALPSFRKLYDFVGGRLAELVFSPSLQQRYESHLICDAHETNRLGVKPVALQVMPDRHGCLVSRKIMAAKGKPDHPLRIVAMRVCQRVGLNCVGLKKTKWDCMSPVSNFDAGDHEDRSAPT